MPPGETYGPSGGAIATVTRWVAVELLKAGNEVAVITPRRLAPDSYYDAGTVHAGPVPKPLRALLRATVGPLERRRGVGWAGEYSQHVLGIALSLLSLPKDATFVVHNDLDLPRLLARLAPRARSVLWLHNEVSTRSSDPKRLLEAPQHIVAVSDSVRRWTIDRYGLAPERVKVIHNGVDLATFHPPPQRPGSGPVKVLCHGRLDPNKGFDLVAQAVSELRDEGVDVTLSVAGAKQVWGLSPEEAESYWEGLFATLSGGVGSYMGRIAPDDLPPILREHDAACAVSRTADPFPLSPLEAMASGCAVVVSNLGGLPEMVREGDGLVVDPKVDAVKSALGRISRDRDLLAQLQLAARKRAEELPWSKTAGELTALVSRSQ